MALFAPMPRASVTTATMLNPGLLSRCRHAYLMSWRSVSMSFRGAKAVPGQNPPSQDDLAMIFGLRSAAGEEDLSVFDLRHPENEQDGPLSDALPIGIDPREQRLVAGYPVFDAARLEDRLA